MIEAELRDILQALLDETGSLAAAIVSDDGDRTGVPSKRRPLGGDRALVLELASRSRKEVEPAEGGAEPAEVDRRPQATDALLEVAARQLRAVARRWNVEALPLLRVPPQVASADRVLARVQAFLRALASATGGHNAVLWRRGKVLGSAAPLDEQQASRAGFLARRALASAGPHSSQAEVVDPDAYAMTFYYGAVLVVTVQAPYAVDFLRHRCRQVARELALLLPSLEPDPEAPAAVRPVP